MPNERPVRGQTTTMSGASRNGRVHLVTRMLIALGGNAMTGPARPEDIADAAHGKAGTITEK